LILDKSRALEAACSQEGEIFAFVYVMQKYPTLLYESSLPANPGIPRLKDPISANIHTARRRTCRATHAAV
jgi:hypothetical protein